jgi:hypothetical protein
MNIKIKNEDKLRNIFKTISWLDDKRWKVNRNYNFIHFFRNDLKNCEKILTHWIGYVTDRQMPYEAVWDEGGYVFSELVYEYSKNKQTVKYLLEKHYEKYRDKNKNIRFRFKSNDGKYFASRFITDDYQNIKQTLEILEDLYERNLIRFILSLIDKFWSKDDLMLRIAFGLYLLTYNHYKKNSSSKFFKNIIKDDVKFEQFYLEFLKKTTNGKKRLWCSIRDYKKGLYHKIFKNAIIEVNDKKANKYIHAWNKLPMHQIELPGDVWNNRPVFRNNLFNKVIDIESIQSNWELPKIIRNLYEQIKKNKSINKFYPEQFDISFDFVPRMCERKLCKICLFGSNGVKSICIPSKDKYCPVALISCGYVTKCKEKNCIIKEGISKGICKEIQNENYKEDV